MHYRVLRLYLEKGMILRKIHCGIRFKEEAIFLKYVEHNLEKRKFSKTAFEKDYYKKLTNVLYGRTLLNVQNYIDVALCTSQSQFIKSLALPQCNDFEMLSPNLSLVLLQKKQLLIDNLPHVGATILDFGKLFFYDTWFKLLDIFGNDIRCIYVDTDGFQAEVTDLSNTFFEKIIQGKEMFDFSRLPADHVLFKKYEKRYPDLRTANKDQCGKLRLESTNISEIICVRPKMYSIKYFDNTELKKCSGTPASNLRQWKHEQYKLTLNQDRPQNINTNSVQCINHQLFTTNVNKLAFDNLDFSRVTVSFNKTLPYGYQNSVKHN